MKREIGDGFELDDHLARVELDVVCRYLSRESYWARGRGREVVERLIREATRVVGLYKDGRQVGFARTVSDGVTFGYLADVFVLEEFRGRGLGLALVREATVDSPLKPRRWLLHTADAHDLYAKLGFGPPDDRFMQTADTDPNPGPG